MNILHPLRSCFLIAARINHHGSLRLQVIQYRVSIVLAIVHFDCTCIDEAIAFGSHFYGVTPHDLISETCTIVIQSLPLFTPYLVAHVKF